MEYINSILDVVVTKIVIPVLAIIASVVILKVKSYVGKMADSTTDKNEKESLKSIMGVMSELFVQLDRVVGAAVAANMALAEKYKSDGTAKLSDDEIKELNKKFLELVHTTLPTVTKTSFASLLGGDEFLDKLIMALLEAELRKPK